MCIMPSRLPHGSRLMSAQLQSAAIRPHQRQQRPQLGTVRGRGRNLCQGVHVVKFQTLQVAALLCLVSLMVYQICRPSPGSGASLCV